MIKDDSVAWSLRPPSNKKNNLGMKAQRRIQQKTPTLQSEHCSGAEEAQLATDKNSSPRGSVKLNNENQTVEAVRLSPLLKTRPPFTPGNEMLEDGMRQGRPHSLLLK